MRKFWVSFPDRGGTMTVRIDVTDDGHVYETYTACPDLRGLHWREFRDELRRRHGEALRFYEFDADGGWHEP